MSDEKKIDCNTELTIVINTCDSYSDVLSLFFAAFSEYWKNCTFEVVINTEKNSHHHYPARTHNYKIGEFNSWGDRFLQTLQAVKSEFVMVVYDDFILEDFVDERQIEHVVNLMKKDQAAAVYYLVNTHLPIVKSNLSGNIFSEIVDRSDFKLNSFPSIWRKTDLSNYIGRNDNPWAWEVFGSYRTFNDGKKFYSLNAGVKDIYSYNYTKGGAIYRGKWVKSVVLNKLEKYRLNIDTGIRGFSEDAGSEARDFSWKINFMLIGFKMIGFKSLRFIPRYIKAKYNARKY